MSFYSNNKNRFASSNLTIDELSQHMLVRFILMRALFDENNISKNRDILLASKMYEYGYDDAIKAVVKIVRSDPENCPLNITLGASRRNIKDIICPDLIEDDDECNWVFNDSVDRRSSLHLSHRYDKFNLNELYDLISKNLNKEIKDLSQLLTAIK